MKNQKQITNRRQGKKLQDEAYRSTINMNRMLEPSPYRPAIVANNTFRFQCNTTGTVTVDLLTLVSILGGVSDGAHGITMICDTVKINSIEVWSKANPGDLVTLEWATLAGAFTRPVVVQDNCVSTSVPAHILTHPPKKELFSDWMSVNAAGGAGINVFYLTCYAGAIIDLNLSFQLWTGGPNGSAQPANSTAAAGTSRQLYYSYLEGFNGPGHYPPVMLNSIN